MTGESSRQLSMAISEIGSEGAHDSETVQVITIRDIDNAQRQGRAHGRTLDEALLTARALHRITTIWHPGVRA